VSLRHSLLALLVVVIWGANFVVIDAGQENVRPLLFLALRFIVVCVPAVFFLKPPGIGWRQLLLVGGFLSLGQFALLYLALALGMPPGSPPSCCRRKSCSRSSSPPSCCASGRRGAN
jgi:O-acetylserine/cysteine efflux transporter